MEQQPVKWTKAKRRWAVSVVFHDLPAAEARQEVVVQAIAPHTAVYRGLAGCMGLAPTKHRQIKKITISMVRV